MRKKIIVIGAGFGGLAAACRLAARGNQVEIFEKREKPGGRAFVYEINGFKFDGGPAVITAPSMFDEIFSLAGKIKEDYFDLVPLNPFYRIFNHDNKYFDLNNDLEFILSEIEKWNPEDKKNYLKFIASSKPSVEQELLDHMNNPYLTIGSMLKAAPKLIRQHSYQSVYKHVSGFIKHDFLRQVFSLHPLLTGGNPFALNSIHANNQILERQWGVYYAMGGTGSVINGLARLFEELGGTIHLNTEVKEIVTSGRLVTGIRLSDGRLEKTDIVISNADAAYTYRSMIPEKYRKKNKNSRFGNMRFSVSLFVIYFGTKKRYNETDLLHHNIILGNRYQKIVNDIFNLKKLPDDLLLYLHMPTKTDSSLAPAGHESFILISPVPHLEAGVAWDQTARIYRDRIMEYLEENYLPDLRANIVAEHFIDPLHFKNTLNSYKGSAYSVEPLITQSAWFRPHNRSEDFKNLFLVGAGTNPGAGIPGVLSSARIVEALIEGS